MMCGAWHSTTADASFPPGEVKGCLSRAASLYLLASITVSYLASSSAPTPLYPIYQAEWGFSPIAISFVFGIYAIAVLGALLVAGRLSDYVGRRPVLIVATAIQAPTMLLFAFADGLSDLIAARVIQGLATGAAIAAIGAGMLDMDKDAVRSPTRWHRRAAPRSGEFSRDLWCITCRRRRISSTSSWQRSSSRRWSASCSYRS